MNSASFHETGVDELDERRLQVVAELAAQVRRQIVAAALVIAAVV